MVLKLMQLLATEKAAKNAAENFFTKTGRDVKKTELITGLARTYVPRVEGAEIFPPERKLVVIRVEESIKELVAVLGDLFDVTAQRDITNTKAKADIILPDGTVLLKDVPSTHLLFLEKKLVDLISFAENLPVLDPADRWIKDDGQNLWATEPTKAAKTKKVEDFKTIVPPTKEHAAQVVKVVEDVITGDWTSTKFSSALQHDQVKKIVARAKMLSKAVKVAREEANTEPVVPLKSSVVLDFIFGA